MLPGRTIISAVFTAIVAATVIAFILPGHRPASWSQINPGMSRKEVEGRLGVRLAPAPEKGFDYALDQHWNGHWEMDVRFKHFENAEVVDHTIQIWFKDLPKWP